MIYLAVQETNTHFCVQKLYSENRVFYGTMWEKYDGVRQGTDNMLENTNKHTHTQNM
jgi:hypothetical protein